MNRKATLPAAPRKVMKNAGRRPAKLVSQLNPDMPMNAPTFSASDVTPAQMIRWPA